MERYVIDRIDSGVSRATINYALKTFNKLGRLATKEWRRRGDEPFIKSFTRAYLIKEKEESVLVAEHGSSPTKESTKNNQARLVVLNSIAKSIVESLAGNNPDYIFSYKGRKLGRLNNPSYRKT